MRLIGINKGGRGALRACHLHFDSIGHRSQTNRHADEIHYRGSRSQGAVEFQIVLSTVSKTWQLLSCSRTCLGSKALVHTSWVALRVPNSAGQEHVDEREHQDRDDLFDRAQAAPPTCATSWILLPK
jgi:hypothetical protein